MKISLTNILYPVIPNCYWKNEFTIHILTIGALRKPFFQKFDIQKNLENLPFQFIALHLYMFSICCSFKKQIMFNVFFIDFKYSSTSSLIFIYRLTSCYLTFENDNITFISSFIVVSYFFRIWTTFLIQLILTNIKVLFFFCLFEMVFLILFLVLNSSKKT